MADRVQLQQVFMNLMLNAIEAMKGAGGKLTIRLRSNPDEDVSLIVSISDTGIGLRTENDADRIFAPFHTTKSQGTGMGLTHYALDRGVLRRTRLGQRNNQEAGATFHFSASKRKSRPHA